MAVRSAQAVWNGSLKEGNGSMKLGSGAFEGAYSFSSRFEEAPGTNPEELIAAAHAGCYSMFLSALLTNNGFTVNKIETSAKIHLGAGPTITLIELNTEASIEGISDEKFQEFAAEAKQKCPVSKALASVEEIKLSATLV